MNDAPHNPDAAHPDGEPTPQQPTFDRPLEQTSEQPFWQPQAPAQGEPFVPSYAQPFAYAEPAPKAPRRPWKVALAGGVAGGVIAAAVAVPVTLWIYPQTDSSTASPSAGAAPQAPQAPDGGTYGGLPDEGTFPGAGPQVDQQPQSTGTTATEDQSQGVVLINTQLPNGEGAGTGMILTKTGLILTNYHVVDGSTAVQVTDAVSGDTYKAEVVGHDATSDVALLQVDADNLTPIDLDTDGTTVGEDVTAVGNGSGQGFLSAVTGTIQAEDQSITASDGGYMGDSEDLTGLLQTDAPVVPGYSGGPLLDSEGEVVGIDTAASANNSTMSSVSGTYESYAVPIDDAMAIVNQIEAGNESGDVQIGPSAYLGVGFDRTGTNALAEVAQGGPAADAGLAVGDTITSIDGTRISSYEALVAALAEHEPGDQVSLTWTGRAGNSHEATVTLGSNPAN